MGKLPDVSVFSGGEFPFAPIPLAQVEAARETLREFVDPMTDPDEYIQHRNRAFVFTHGIVVVTAVRPFRKHFHWMQSAMSRLEDGSALPATATKVSTPSIEYLRVTPNPRKGTVLVSAKPRGQDSYMIESPLTEAAGQLSGDHRSVIRRGQEHWVAFPFQDTYLSKLQEAMRPVVEAIDYAEINPEAALQEDND